MAVQVLPLSSQALYPTAFLEPQPHPAPFQCLRPPLQGELRLELVPFRVHCPLPRAPARRFCVPSTGLTHSRTTEGSRAEITGAFTDNLV